MKKFLIPLTLSMNLTVHAALDKMVLIQGYIDSSNKANINVTDTHGQKIAMPRALFPKKFDFRSGKFFSLEVSEETFDSLKIRPNQNK